MFQDSPKLINIIPDNILRAEGTGCWHDGPLVEAAGLAGGVQLPGLGAGRTRPHRLQRRPDHLEKKGKV